MSLVFAMHGRDGVVDLAGHWGNAAISKYLGDSSTSRYRQELRTCAVKFVTPENKKELEIAGNFFRNEIRN